MCGITALVDTTGAGLAERLSAATAQLRHRGPDGSGVWVEEAGSVGLGHARLSVIDLEHGQQPLSNEDGTIRATINGEFYDAEPIRAALIARGHRFRTHSDSEILLHLYEEQDIECLRALRGEFAFALWDARRARLWAARDRFGIKPLFYSTLGGALALASEAKSLFALGLPAAWDQEAVIEQLFFFARQDRTPFANVRQVPPGHYLLREGERLAIRRYWDLDFPEAGDTSTQPEAEQVERFRDALREAVRVRLRSDVPLTVFLSGGLDSSCILALAAAGGEAAPDAIHVSFSGTDYDESGMARDAAAWVGSPLDVMEIGEPDLARHFAEAVWHGETLAFNAHGVARFLQSRRARSRGFKVALTGEGADETLGGYPGFRADAAPGAGRGAAHGRQAPALRMLHDRLGFSPAWIGRIHAERAAFYALLSAPMLAAVDVDAMSEAFLDQFDQASQLRGRDPLHQAMYLWSKSVLPNYTLCADRLDMAHGVETRPPFLDHRLWEVTRTMPPDRLIRGMREKWLLREASAGLVPEAIRWRSKHSFTAPAVSSRGPLRDLANDELRGAAFRSLPFFDTAAVIALLDLLDQAPAPALDSVVMMVLSLHLLNRAFRVG